MNKEAYNKIAKEWIAYRSQSFLSELVIDFAKKLPKQAKVLDIGCGAAYPISSFLSDSGFDVTGIDVSERLLAHAKELNIKNAKFILCDFFEFRPSKQFDGIIAFDSFFHFPKERQKEIYQMVSNWMNQGAYLLFTHGSKDGEIEGEMFGETFYYSCLSLIEIKNLIKKAGLEIVEIHENYIEKQTQKDLVVLARKVVK